MSPLKVVGSGRLDDFHRRRTGSLRAVVRSEETQGRAAAIFDRDRTVVKGASAPDIRKALAAVGLTSEKGLPGEGVLLRLYDALGESIPHMALARLAAFAAAGWSADAARQAGEMVAELLNHKVAPFARVLLDEHRDAGHLLVLATTTPRHLVAPFARLLGFDDVVATCYEEKEGRFTGRLEGRFIWSGWKLAAIRSWSDRNGVDLRTSFAYSDSVYDSPLLGAVGHPYAVNPDPALRAVALARRWPVLHLDVPPGVPKLAGLEPFDVVAMLARPQMLPFARFRFHGVEKVPPTGPVIIAANHRSYFDVAAVGLLAVKAGRPVRFLAKKEVTDAPVVGQFTRAMGAIRVDRGSGSSEPLNRAVEALRAGDAVGVFPQGTIPRGRDFFEPHLAGRTGVARLVYATGAPLVPVGIWGTERVWPRSRRLPAVTRIVDAPEVVVTVGDPIPASSLPKDARQATQMIMDTICDLLPPEARVPREPSDEEITRATPPGRRKTAG